MESQQLIGQILDEKYHIHKLLGQGGMGSVYLATHQGTGRPVAVKIIAPQYMANEEFVERFRREARAAGLLRHPNIVDVTDFGFATLDSSRLAYLVMEYLDGVTLSEILQEEKKLPINWVVDIFEQICLAVNKAHEQGIVHRDLKPENIWLEPNERCGYTVKVLDFGIAKFIQSGVPAITQSLKGLAAPSTDALSAETAQPAATLVYTLEETAHQSATAPDQISTTINQSTNTGTTGGITRTGALLGTPLYMSPEQCFGKPLDSRTDIYSLGVIAYQMLTGETPFQGDLYTLFAQHTQVQAPPMRQKRADIPKAAEELVLSALAKSPDHRPVSAAAFASALRSRVEGAGTILRQAFVLYTQNFRTFLWVSLLAYLPSIALTILNPLSFLLFGESNIVISNLVMSALVVFGVLTLMFAQAINAGIFVPITAQLLITPLTPLDLKLAFGALKKRLRIFLSASVRFNVIGNASVKS